MADTFVMLEVPISQKDEAKALGARWDPDARSWYVPAGRDATPFARWLPPPVRTHGPTIPARLLGQAERCYRCTGRGTALTGLLVSPRYSLDPCGFISFDSVPRALAALVNDTPLAERYNIGRIRMRSSFAHPSGYVANACPSCDALWGSFPLQESVTEFLAGGGSYDRLVIGELAFPIAALPKFQAARDDEDDWDEDDWEDDAATPGAANEIAPAALSPGRTSSLSGDEQGQAHPATVGESVATDPCELRPTGPTARRWRPWRR